MTVYHICAILKEYAMRRIRILREAKIRRGMSVLVRADFDVPVAGDRVRDDARIRAALPTIRSIVAEGARVRIIAHRARPGGRPSPAYSLAPVGRALAAILGRRVVLVKNPFASGALETYGGEDSVLLFENIRFWPGEEKNDRAFASSLARWGEAYVNEAFAVCHRAHASVALLPRVIPAFAGLHLMKEITALDRARAAAERPFVAVLGGAKLETKLPLFRRFMRQADIVLVGGALANTLLAARGQEIGQSVVEIVSLSRALVRAPKLCLPTDAVVSENLTGRRPIRARKITEIRSDEYIVDIGPATRRMFARAIRRAKIVVWNGPLGLTEVPAFATGTAAIADAIARNRGFTVVGGGDTLAAVSGLVGEKTFSHVSMGGGAMLAYLAGERLPGIEALKR